MGMHINNNNNSYLKLVSYMGFLNKGLGILNQLRAVVSSISDTNQN